MKKADEEAEERDAIITRLEEVIGVKFGGGIRALKTSELRALVLALDSRQRTLEGLEEALKLFDAELVVMPKVGEDRIGRKH